MFRSLTNIVKMPVQFIMSAGSALIMLARLSGLVATPRRRNRLVVDPLPSKTRAEVDA